MTRLTELGLYVQLKLESLHMIRVSRGVSRAVWPVQLIRHNSVLVGGKEYKTDEWTNIPPAIIDLVGRNLHRQPNHPIGIIRSLIEKRLVPLGFTPYNEFSPIVSKYKNFDSLGFPEDHPGRSKSDTYYINKDTLLRTHTSAHEIECFQTTKTPGYLIAADVYRRDTIDRTHYPAFHQMEGARTWSKTEHGDKLADAIRADLEALPDSGIQVEDPNPPFHAGNPKEPAHSEEVSTLLGQHLKRTIEIVMGDMFSAAKAAAIANGSTDPDLHKPLKARWIEAHFPWTSPSWEIEIWWKGEWLEMSGMGVVRQHVYDTAGMSDCVGWAFGIGLERTAMILFGVPDIRLFWSKDPRFLDQFTAGKVTNFEPWSKYPSTSRDVAFWCPEQDVHENDVMEIVRSRGGDLVENVSLVDEFVHPKTNRKSQCYRITYQSMERSLTNDEVNAIQTSVVDDLTSQLGIEVR